MGVEGGGGGLLPGVFFLQGREFVVNKDKFEMRLFIFWMSVV